MSAPPSIFKRANENYDDGFDQLVSPMGAMDDEMNMMEGFSQPQFPQQPMMPPYGMPQGFNSGFFGDDNFGDIGDFTQTNAE